MEECIFGTFWHFKRQKLCEDFIASKKEDQIWNQLVKAHLLGPHIGWIG